jgi:hypothetical protein
MKTPMPPTVRKRRADILTTFDALRAAQDAEAALAKSLQTLADRTAAVAGPKATDTGLTKIERDILWGE